MRNWNRLLA